MSRTGNTRTRAGRMLSDAQMRVLENVPAQHEFVSFEHGVPLLRRPDGRLLCVHRDGSLHLTSEVPSAVSYLQVVG